MTKKKLSTLFLTLFMTLSFTACGQKTGTQPVERPSSTIEASNTNESQTIDTFIVGTNAEITAANRSEYNYDVISGTLSQLAPIWVDEAGEFHALLCNFSTDDSKTWTLTVMDGMKWHDGKPVTADDIKFTLEYMDTQTDGGYAERYLDIRVLNDKTIELELERPNPRELSNLTTLRIMPKHIYDGVSDYTTVDTNLANIGCGPYKFSRFDSNAGVVEFTAFEAYPAGTPKVKNVIIKLFDNEDTMYMALKAGEIDMVYKYSGGINPTVIEDLQKAGNLTLYPVHNTANSATLIFNNNVKPFQDNNLRMAVSYAIDYDAFRKTFGSAYAISSTAGFIPKGTYGYIETEVLKRDLEKAKDYLKAAGCVDKDGDGYVEYNDETLTLPIMLRDDKPVHTRYAELLKNNLEEIGILVTLDVQEVANFRELTEKQQAQTAIITGLTSFGMAKNQGLASLYLWGENSMGYGQVFDTSYKALLDKADVATSMEEYKAVAEEIQNYYAQTRPAIALFWDAHVQAYKSKYDGFIVDGTFGIMNVQSFMNLSLIN